MTTSKKNQSALRATLKQEDAAVAERLPAVASTAAARETSAPAPAKLRSGARTKAVTATAKPAAIEPAARKATASKQVVTKPAAPKPPAAKPAVGRLSSGQSSAPTVIADKGVVAPVAPSVASGAARAPNKAKAGKLVRDAFSIPKNEQADLKNLRNVLARAGRPATKSEMLRAAVRLLSQCSVSEMLAVLDALPVVAKDKGKRKGKDKK